MFCLCTSSFTENYLQTTCIWIYINTYVINNFPNKNPVKISTLEKKHYTSYYKFNSRKHIRALSHSDSLCFKAFSQTLENVVTPHTTTALNRLQPTPPTHEHRQSNTGKLKSSLSLSRARVKMSFGKFNAICDAAALLLRAQ